MEQPEQGTQLEQPVDEELISSLISEANNSQPENAEEQKPEKKEEPPEATKDVPQVTIELAKQYGLSKNFVGKPLEEVLKAYSEANKTISRLGGENSKLKKQLSEPPPKEDITDDFPDPIDDIEGFKKALNEKIKSLSVKETPKDKGQEFIEQLSEKLPDVNIKELLTDFQFENEEELLEYAEDYQNNPKLLMKEIIKFHNTREKQKTDEEERKKKVENKHQKVENKFNVQKKASDFASRSREEEDPFLSSLLSEAEAQEVNI